MSPYLRVALCGFNDFEQRALNTVLRLGGPSAGPYVQVAEVADADLIVGNADVPEVVAAIATAAREADTVFIGSRPPARALQCLRRPIDAMQVLRELDGMRARRVERGTEAVPTRRAPQDHAPVSPQPKADAVHATTAVPLPKPDPAPAAPGETALVVDDSLIAASLLQWRLRQIGLSVEVADNSPSALELLAHRPFTWVFLGVGLGEAGALDGLALCRHVKRWHLHPEACPPKVVMVSAHYSPLDRVRGTFAGCDHYLATPVDDDTLRQLVLPSQARTDRATRRWAVARARATPSRP